MGFEPMRPEGQTVFKTDYRTGEVSYITRLLPPIFKFCVSFCVSSLGKSRRNCIYIAPRFVRCQSFFQSSAEYSQSKLAILTWAIHAHFIAASVCNFKERFCAWHSRPSAISRNRRLCYVCSFRNLRLTMPRFVNHITNHLVYRFQLNSTSTPILFSISLIPSKSIDPSTIAAAYVFIVSANSLSFSAPHSSFS